MIFVRDKGRMCNNILQYAHVYAWGREHGRSTLSMRFAYKYKYFKISHQPRHNFLSYLTGKYAAKTGLIKTVAFNTPGEPTAEKEKIMLSRRNLMVEGWEVRFYDLFLKYKSEILDLFTFDKSISDKTDRFIADTSRPDDLCLGLHIRRGDYIRWKKGRYFYDDATYLRVVREFAELFPDKKLTVYICGNDPALDREYFRRGLPGINVVFPDGDQAEDLCLLSKCDYLIGPPSTFSLVAAMYRDLPLWWIDSKDSAVNLDKFRRFDYLFRHII